MSDAEKFVRERYPDARLHGPMLNGRAHPDGWYGILLYGSQSFTSGHGKTVIEAWADAANRIQEEEGIRPAATS